MSIFWTVLNKIRYVICLLLIMTVGLLTVPFVIFFNWDGIWLLCIMNEELCSLSEAKRLLQEQRNIQDFYEHITSKGFKVKSKNGLIKLTPAEINCLHLLAKSQSAKEIARKLNISHRTVVRAAFLIVANTSDYRLFFMGKWLILSSL